MCDRASSTRKFVHKRRGLEAMVAIGIIPRYGGVIIHDCWASYLSYEHCGHGLCGAHLLRELTFIVESNGYAWARNMKRLLQHTCARVSKRKRKRLTPREYDALQKRYRNILTRGERELPPIPAKQNGKRGRVAKSDAHNLWERLKEYESAVLLFARDSHVAFTKECVSYCLLSSGRYARERGDPAPVLAFADSDGFEGFVQAFVAIAVLSRKQPRLAPRVESGEGHSQAARELWAVQPALAA